MVALLFSILIAEIGSAININIQHSASGASFVGIVKLTASGVNVCSPL